MLMILTCPGRTGFKIDVPRPSRNGSKRNTKRKEQQRKLAPSQPQRMKARQAHHQSLPARVSAGMRSPRLLASLTSTQRQKRPTLLVMGTVQTMDLSLPTMRMTRLLRMITLPLLRATPPTTCTLRLPLTSHQKLPTSAMLNAIKATPT